MNIKDLIHLSMTCQLDFRLTSMHIISDITGQSNGDTLLSISLKINQLHHHTRSSKNDYIIEINDTHLYELTDKKINE